MQRLVGETSPINTLANRNPDPSRVDVDAFRPSIPTGQPVAGAPA